MPSVFDLADRPWYLFRITSTFVIRALSNNDSALIIFTYLLVLLLIISITIILLLYFKSDTTKTLIFQDN